MLFVVTPCYLLSHVVMPEISSLQQTYAHADAYAARMTEQTDQ